MIVREYEESDQQQLIALWHQCGLVKPQNDPVKDIARKLKVNRDLFLIGVKEGEIIASVMGGYEGHRGWINYLAVSLAQQRKGYGQLIMKMVEARIKSKGCPKINLQVRAGNAEIVAFYEAIGYGNDKVIGLGKRLEYDSP